MSMNEQSQSNMATAIDNTLGESSEDNTQPDVTFALSNIDNEMGRLTYSLIQMFEQNKPPIQPFEPNGQ